MKIRVSKVAHTYKVAVVLNPTSSYDRLSPVYLQSALDGRDDGQKLAFNELRGNGHEPGPVMQNSYGNRCTHISVSVLPNKSQPSIPLSQFPRNNNIP
jgi:hypothetical protein